ncbi:MAG: hypothetical protein OXG05_00060 [Gammaproteobacteria bacterium]|nr:hypothetical protein [Gammaproteobacteria bacterium]
MAFCFAVDRFVAAAVFFAEDFEVVTLFARVLFLVAAAVFFVEDFEAVAVLARVLVLVAAARVVRVFV